MGRGVIRPVSMAARVWVVGLMDADVAVTSAVISIYALRVCFVRSVRVQCQRRRRVHRVLLLTITGC
jgi:carbohydrate-binding DOMON domain-containing protein